MAKAPPFKKKDDAGKGDDKKKDNLPPWLTKDKKKPKAKK